MNERFARLRGDVEALATPAGREVGSAGHERAREYLLGRLDDLGLQPYDGEGFSLPYRVGRVDFANLVAVVPGSDRSLPPLLLGAHYDTAGPLPGADDNAAAVAIALAVAERLRTAPGRRDVVVALFDAEEPPYYLTGVMGSNWFYEHQRHGDFQAALIPDLVGHDVPLPALADLLFITGMESGPCLETAILGTSVPDGLRIVTALNRYVGDVSDHHAFRMGGTPYLFFSCGRWEHYHAPTDTPDKLNYQKMAATVDLLEALLRNLADLGQCVPDPDHDTTPTDLMLMKASLGPIAKELGYQLESRADIDEVAGMLGGLLGI
jgi:hypothetical protein